LDDDRTLVAEGSDVFVNTAQALSPTSKTISDLFGASHPEAIVRTDTTIAGGLQLQRCVGFEGDKLTVISEFAVKTVLEKKMAIEKEAILLMMRLLAIDLEYTLLLTTLNIRCTFLMLQRTVKQNSTT
jgi:hypothetical protein